jgi:hypothetical protein
MVGLFLLGGADSRRMSSDLAGKRVELLKEVAPAIRRVGVFVNPANANNMLVLKEAELAAPVLAGSFSASR